MYNSQINSEVLYTIKSFNKLLEHSVTAQRFNIIDVFRFTAGKNGFSNGLMHIDPYHLGPEAITEIEKQLLV